MLCHRNELYFKIYNVFQFAGNLKNEIRYCKFKDKVFIVFMAFNRKYYQCYKKVK